VDVAEVYTATLQFLLNSYTVRVAEVYTATCNLRWTDILCM